MHERFSQRIEEGLASLARRIDKSQASLDRGALERQIGRLLQKNSRAAARYSISITEERSLPCGVKLKWNRRREWDDWTRASEGAYILRSNIAHWSDEELWKTYMQLTEAEAAFRIHKSELCLRPIWHHKANRIEAHILVCFLAYVLWKTLQQWQSRAGLGDSPRTILTEFLAYPIGRHRVAARGRVKTRTQNPLRNPPGMRAGAASSISRLESARAPQITIDGPNVVATSRPKSLI